MVKLLNLKLILLELEINELKLELNIQEKS